MKLLVEQRYGTSDIISLTESVEGGAKQYFIEGIFLQSGKANRNNRVYPRGVMKREVDRFVKESVQPRAATALGELGHPTGDQGPILNMERVSHMIQSLSMSGDDVIGRAKILDTPYGKIVKTFMDEGVALGVSSRGLGSLGEADQSGIAEVQDDFRLATVDIVAEPSCRDAVVESILESKEWSFVDGHIVEGIHNIVKKAKGNKALEEAKIKAFKMFMDSLRIDIS